MKKEEWLSHKADQIVSETDPTSIVPTVEMRLYKQVSRIAVKKKKKDSFEYEIYPNAKWVTPNLQPVSLGTSFSVKLLLH